jgi:hypothetical protein
VADDDRDFFERESELFRIAYERKPSDKSALLQTIMFSILFRQPLPEWAARAFEDAYFRVTMGGARSWDEVFGDSHLGKHKRSVALWNRKYGVHKRVRRLHERGAPIDEGLFERVGAVFGRVMNPDKKPIGKTVISELYYYVERIQRRLRAETSGK